MLGWKKYSSLTKLRSVTANVMRFVRNTRVKKEERLIGPLKWTELRKGRKLSRSTTEEIVCLGRGQEIHKRSRIKSLDPRLEDGVLVVGGRLRRA